VRIAYLLTRSDRQIGVLADFVARTAPSTLTATKLAQDPLRMPDMERECQVILYKSRTTNRKGSSASRLEFVTDLHDGQLTALSRGANEYNNCQQRVQPEIVERPPRRVFGFSTRSDQHRAVNGMPGVSDDRHFLEPATPATVDPRVHRVADDRCASSRQRGRRLPIGPSECLQETSNLLRASHGSHRRGHRGQRQISLHRVPH
jgi:hypothetical protein